MARPNRSSKQGRAEANAAVCVWYLFPCLKVISLFFPGRLGLAEAVSHELEMRFALMTDGTRIGVNVVPAIVEEFFVFATKAIRGAHCIPSVFATEVERIHVCRIQLTPCSRE